MHIERATLRGIKRFGELHLDFRAEGGRVEAGWTVIAGPNGSGKTTFLRALVLPLVGLNNAFRLMGFRDWIAQGRPVGEVEVSLAPGGPVRAAWERREEEPIFSLETWAMPDLFLCAYGPSRRLTGVAEAARSNIPALARVLPLFREDAALVGAISWLQDVHLRALEEKPGAAALKELAIQILNDDLLPEGIQIKRVDSDGLWTTQGKSPPLLVQELSDGYRSVTALVLDLIRRCAEMAGEAPFTNGNRVLTEGVVLIDEVDAHLHPSWQKKIGFWLKTHFPNIQFIVTTHSPFICQAADPGGLFMLPPLGTDAAARRLEGADYWRVVNGGADDAVLSPLFGLEYAHSARSEALREELALLEVRLMQDRGSPEDMARYQELREQLPDLEEGLLRALLARP